MTIIHCPWCDKPLTLLKSTEEPSTSTPEQPTSDLAERIVCCNRCGQTGLAWAKSNTSGKWYLAQTRLGQDGERYIDRRKFHKCEGGAE